MNQHWSFASIQFLHDGIEEGVAGPFVAGTRIDSDAVALQRVVGVFDFFQASIDVGERQSREQAQPLGIGLHTLCAEIVACPDQGAGFWRTRIELFALHGQRKQRSADVEFVHRFERHLGRPFRIAYGSGNWRPEMMMNVDAPAFRRQRPDGGVVIPAAVLRHSKSGRGASFDKSSTGNAGHIHSFIKERGL